MFGLIPLPQSISVQEGICDISAGIKIGKNAFPEEVAVLQEWLVRAGVTFVNNSPCVLQVTQDNKLHGEAYHLHIGAQCIEITSATAAGTMRAAATLWQLVLSEGARLPCVTIEDSPSLEWRGLLLDCARNFFRVEFIKKILDGMALHKLNTLHWHLTDDQAWRPYFKCAPELTQYGSRRLDRRVNIPRYKEGFYTSEDMREIVRYAAARHIQVVPEIECPGHVTALLASHPELSCMGATASGGAFEPEDRYGVFEDILCAGKDGVFELYTKIIAELVTIFPAQYVHMGGDEAPKRRWNECPHCRARMQKLNLRNEAGDLDAEKLQAWFMGQIAEILASHGKKMVGWDEILEGGVRKDAIIMSWRGNGPGIKGAKNGYKIVMTPTTNCYLDHKNYDSPEESGFLAVCNLASAYSLKPIPQELNADEAKNIIGAQANMWSEYAYTGSDIEYQLFPRLCALAEVFWTPEKLRNLDDFSTRMKLHGLRLDALNYNRYHGKYK